MRFAWVVLVTVGIPAMAIAGSGMVTARNEKLALNTYPFGDPDPVAPVTEKRYPYFRYDGSSANGKTQEWDAVVLESDRMRLTMVPAVGGKIWGATDKLSGRDFIYFNHAAKFRNIAMRGPWVSGGIEYNFGIIGHAPSTSTAVDWCVRTNEDRSVSYFCSNVEWINRTTWQVEVNLRAGDDFFTMRTLWANTANLPGPYYQWMNAAFSTQGDPELLFPGAFQVGHEGDAHPWPKDERGRELNYVNRNDFGGNKSYHVVGGDVRFFGVWWREWGLGAYHLNDFGEKYGRKAWIWALSREGGIWEDLLTDTDGQYMELQSGRCFNQPRRETYRTPFKHPTFAAGATDSFEEKWGIIRDRENIPEKVRATNRVERAEKAPADFDWTTAYGLYVRGEQALRERDDEVADENLRAALAKEPCLSPALTTLAELDYRRARDAEARELTEKALAINAYDAEANYLSGLLAKAEGNWAKALERLGLAAYSPLFRTAALAEMAKVHLIQGDYERALKTAERCAETEAKSPDGFRLRALALEKLGRGEEARRVRAEQDRVWPLLDCEPRGEFAGETLVERGLWQVSCGQTDAAKRLLAKSGTFIGALHLAWIDRDVGALKKLAERSVAFVFPFRRETVPALDWAVAHSDSWKFRYLRALFAAANGDKEGARGLDRNVVLEKGWRLGKAAMERAAAEGDWKTVKSVGERYLAECPGCDPIELLYAQALVRLGEHRACLEFLETVEILPSEFGENATDTWHEAQKALGLPLTWPERLGKGKPYPEEISK